MHSFQGLVVLLCHRTSCMHLLLVPLLCQTIAGNSHSMSILFLLMSVTVMAHTLLLQLMICKWNVQWMSHHSTNPTYIHVLSRTMTQLSAQFSNTTTKTTQNKHTHPKGVCQLFDTLYANIVKIIFDIQYLRSVTKNRPKQLTHWEFLSWF